jgi:ubiquinone/menaquinone biosynthesis C-methylase UbiE
MNSDEYVKLAEVEDRLWYFRSLHAHVSRLLDGARVGTDGKKVDLLDAGCGTGGMLLRLRARQPEWTYRGIDFMPLACELTRQRCGPDIEIREASVTALPFADESFDVVVSADVICQITEADVAVKEFFRVLRPGGSVVINVPAYMWMWSYHDINCQTKYRYTRPEIDALLCAARFEERCTTHWNALALPLMWAKRKVFASANETSDMKSYPAAVDVMFGAMTAFEHAWLRAGGRWAWGTSVLAVARKPLK